MSRSHTMPRLPESLPDGIYAASLTPVTGSLEIDHQLLTAHCRWLLANGCSGIVLLGTTGEANSFSVAERMAALDAVVDGGIAPTRLLVGTGCAALSDTVALTQHALSREVGGVLVLPPFYYKGVSDAGIFSYFEALIERVADERLNIYLYHIPQMSMVPFSPALFGRLVDMFPRQIAGIKDSGGSWDHMKALRERYPGLRVFPGSETFLRDMLLLGGPGCISATANINSRLAARVYQQFDRPAAQEMQEALNQLRGIILNYPVIPALKQVMAAITAQPGWRYLRPPLMPLSEPDAARLMRELEAVDFPAQF
ncbi:MAG: dihydrodipicolinate synthase family protein [Calditrichaeota bacterium]|nr:dihydrodipicolinate synthase family protein [Calditrichota bacterium]